MSDKPRPSAGLSPDEIELLQIYGRLDPSQKRGMQILGDLLSNPTYRGKGMTWVIRELETTAGVLHWMARSLQAQEKASRERPDWLRILKGGSSDDAD